MNEDTRDILVSDNHRSARSFAAENRLAREISDSVGIRHRVGIALIELGERVSGIAVEPVKLHIVPVNGHNHNNC